MINIPILKKNFREHIWLWGIVTAVLVLYLFLLLGTYAPDGKAGVILLFSGLPSAVQTALGAGNYGLSLSGILGGYFWENIFTLVPFVVSIPVAASFVFCDFRVLTDVPWRILPAFLPWGPAVCDICNV
mgnify:CR=1 FL=1